MRSDSSCSRREVLGALAGASLAAALPESVAPSARSGDMIYRTLGQTGIKVSAIGLGGSHMGSPADENDGIRIVRTAIDRGITFMDNCWDYHDGKSEVVMGKALRDGYREKVFLMTKFDGRTKDAAAQPDRRIAAAAADGPYRPDAVSRKHPAGGSGPFLRAGRTAGSAAGGQEGRQDPLHRIHRAQRSDRASADAGTGGGAPVPLRQSARCR